MNRLTLLACAAAAILAACGGSGAEPSLAFPEREVREPAGATASIAGTVRFGGQPPKRRELPAPDPACRSAGNVILDETIVVEDGRLRDVLVWIEKGAERWTFAYERSAAEVDQRGCVFLPHVAAVRTWQPLRFLNSDPVVHNVNCSTAREGFARNVSPRDRSFTVQFEEPELGKRVVCDLHGNMLMYVHVLEHPWFDVTGPDGAFAIDGLPAGSYVLAARHERLGTKRRELVLEDGGGATADFTFEMK